MRKAWIATVVFSMLASLVNYGSNLAFSRILKPAGFSELTALLALSVVITVPIGAGQTLVADAVARARATDDLDAVRALLRRSLGHVISLGFVAGALSLALTPVISSILDIAEPGPVIAFSILVAVSFALPVVLGGLQGLQEFLLFGFFLLAIALSRLVVGVVWAALGGGAGGAIAGQALGILVVCGIALVVWRSWLGDGGAGIGRGGMLKKPSFAALRATAAFAAVAVLANLDVVLSRVFLEPNEAGLYAALATLAKVAIFLPSAVGYIMVPAVTKAHSEDTSSLNVLRRAAIASLVIVTPFVVLALGFPAKTLGIMFGTQYQLAAAGVLPILVSGVGIALISLICTYSVVVKNRSYVAILIIGLLIQVILISAFHDSVTELAWAQACAVVLVLVVSEVRGHPLVAAWRSTDKSG